MVTTGREAKQCARLCKSEYPMDHLGDTTLKVATLFIKRIQNMVERWPTSAISVTYSRYSAKGA